MVLMPLLSRLLTLLVILDVLLFLVFFFQAEDGIRDLIVTGVQTCALPIYHHGRRARGAAAGSHRASLQARDALRRQVPHHRLRAVELRELGDPPDLHSHAVQGAVADPARAARLELPAR